MSENDEPLGGVDLAHGIPLDQVPATGEPLLGHFDGEPVLLVRDDDGVRALGAKCTHYGGPLNEGLRDGDTIRCPWHHACFSLRTGEALAAPALNPLPTWAVTIEGGRVRLGARTEATPLERHGLRDHRSGHR